MVQSDCDSDDLCGSKLVIPLEDIRSYIVHCHGADVTPEGAHRTCWHEIKASKRFESEDQFEEFASRRLSITFSSSRMWLSHTSVPEGAATG